MGFSAQQNVSTGGYIDATKGIRDVLSGTQNRLFKQGLQSDRLRQNAMDNKFRNDKLAADDLYRKEQAAALASHRAGINNRANAAEARNAAIYKEGQDAKAADALASTLYSDVSQTTGLTGDPLKDKIAQAQGGIVAGDKYQAIEQDLIKQSDSLAIIKERADAAEATYKSKYGGAPGMRKTTEQKAVEADARAEVDALKGQAKYMEKFIQEGADKYASEYNKDSKIVMDEVAKKHAVTSKSNTQYAKDLKADLLVQAKTAKGAALTKTEEAALDRKVKGYVDTRTAIAAEATAAATGLEKLQAETTIKEKTKSKYAKPDSTGKSKEQKARFEYEEAKAQLDSGNYSGSGNWFGIADGDEEKALKAKISAYEKTYGKPGN